MWEYFEKVELLVLEAAHCAVRKKGVRMPRFLTRHTGERVVVP